MDGERRKNMDAESKEKFEKLEYKLEEVRLCLEKLVSYNEGLDTKNRLTLLETDINKKATWQAHDDLDKKISKKASWTGLYAMGGFVVSMLGLMFVFLKFIQDITEKLVN